MENLRSANYCQILSEQILTKLCELLNETRRSNRSEHEKRQNSKRSYENWRANHHETKVMSPRSRGRCFNCGAFQHRGVQCPYLDQGTRCFRCSSFGHISTSCDNVTTLRRQRESIKSSMELLSSLEREFVLLKQKFDSHMRRTRSFEEEAEKENENLRTIIENLREECTKLKRTVYAKDKCKAGMYTKQVTENIDEHEQLSFSNEQEKIKTFVRMKYSNNVTECFKWNRDSTGRILSLFSDDGILTNQFNFDRIFGPNEDNERIFNSMSPMMKLAIEGYNVCVISYGVSGSGKTHTMIGNDVQPGIIPKSMNFIFENGSRNISDLKISCSIFEIYNEHYYDLLDRNEKQDDLKKIAEVQIKSINEFFRIFNMANNFRKTANTMRNQLSSRSHAVYRITMKGLSRETNNNLNSNVIMLDCAGQENFNDLEDDAENQVRSYEMSNINKAHSTFASVIRCLKRGDEFVNFRNSKLTFLLKPYLTGSAKTLIIATTSSEKKYLQTSKSIYRIINSANKIKCKSESAKSKTYEKIQRFKPLKIWGGRVNTYGCHSAARVRFKRLGV